jgi:hypothetical protein
MKNAMHIAPCGMNCSLCLAYQRDKNNCAGCNGHEKNKPKHCTVCYIRNCGELIQTGSDFCSSCFKFPCKRLQQLDTRYRTKYGMSMIQNLQTIKLHGINKFTDMEITKWTCRACGSLLCVHRETCQHCGNKKVEYPGNL